MAKKDPIVEFLNIDMALAKNSRNRIARLGVEVEGGWTSIPPGVLELERDSSVFGGRTPVGYQVGELGLGPMQPMIMARMVKKHYPQLVDATCGLHLHMAFETLYQYMLLADSPAYQETIIEYLRRWALEEHLDASHPLWNRLKGDSIYCQKKFWPQEQMATTRKDYDKHRHGHRYTMIHYCWGRYQTIECRLLPMMQTADQAVRVLKRLLDITNAYLSTVDKKRVRETGKVALDNGDIYEEYVEAKL